MTVEHCQMRVLRLLRLTTAKHASAKQLFLLVSSSHSSALLACGALTLSLPPQPPLIRLICPLILRM